MAESLECADLEATWTYSSYHGWVLGYSYEVVVTAGKNGPVWPLLASADPCIGNQRGPSRKKSSGCPRAHVTYWQTQDTTATPPGKPLSTMLQAVPPADGFYARRFIDAASIAARKCRVWSKAPVDDTVSDENVVNSSSRDLGQELCIVDAAKLWSPLTIG